MAHRCSICQHKRITAIDRALLDGAASVRSIAKDFAISESSLRRHRKNCLAQRLAGAAVQAREADVVTAINVVEQLHTINREAHEILREARSSGDARLALRALDRIERQLVLQARLADLISDGANVSVAVKVDTGWPIVRSAILETLQDYPAALQAVADRLAALEQSA